MKRNSSKPIAKSLLVLSTTLCLCAGCKSIGPHTVARDRYDYSSSISESWKRQTLLNIVKLRYLDPPIFVDVGQIVAGYSLETGITAGGSFPENSGLGGTTATIGGSAKYTDRPTITYVPLTGNQFVKALMTPLPPESVFFMIQSGWPADSVLMAAAASVNGLKNQETGLGGVSPPTPEFLRALELLRNIQRSGAVSLRVKAESPKQQATILTFRSEQVSAGTLAEIQELRGLLRLDPAASEFKLVFGSLASGKTELAVLTRSILQIMSTMAGQAEVPVEDVEQGRATPGLRSGDLTPSTHRLMRIHCTKSKPTDAAVAVPYRNQWYWIDDRDLHSKRAFSFMLMLFTLSDAGPKENLPLITIPAQ